MGLATHAGILIGKPTIGIGNRGNLLMLMTESGTFYRYTEGFLCKDGENIEEMLNCVIGECREPIYFE